MSILVLCYNHYLRLVLSYIIFCSFISPKQYTFKGVLYE
nr:MAG TPA: hypothetical protein [Caudoviricetes sp.]